MNLGIKYSPKTTVFRVWAPKREKIQLLIYENHTGENESTYKMNKYSHGVHETIVKDDLKDKYYTYLIDETYEVTDPYSIASSVNSTRSAIVDLRETNPSGWESHSRPAGGNICNEIIYEVHIKDFTFHPSSGVSHRGKYLGFCEKIDHLVDLGITCVHLMPVYDFLTVNEDNNEFYNKENYNWGYDPELYNVPEGSYGLDSLNPKSRIIELKTLIMKLHQAGIKVILDVVYNHTYKSINSNFNILNPDYFYRLKEDGSFSDGSGCGNELATERPMVRKFILDSLNYWLSEYKVDGFRFDLMALMDRDTMGEIVHSLRDIKEDIIIYGEPWAGGDTVLDESMMITKGKQGEFNIAVFNDDFRDAIKGDNDGEGKGFSQGNKICKIDTQIGIVGSIDYDNQRKGFAHSPKESINYINSHDNLILYDKMKNTFPNVSHEELIKYNKLALSILFTSQGIPFIHGGNEFLRGKNMVSNSYKSSMEVNEIDWSLKDKNIDFYNYVKDLICLRKSYEEFRIENSKEIKSRVRFLENIQEDSLIAYTIGRKIKGEYLLVFHNGGEETFVDTSFIKEHLETRYKIYADDLRYKKIFDFDGFVREEKCGLPSIKVNRTSTGIYKIYV